MKLRSLIIAAAASSAIFASTAAQALVVNFSGSNVNMGNLQDGQTGTISNILTLNGSHQYESLVLGNLPRLSEVTLYYTFPVDYVAGALDAKITYDFMQSGVHHNGFSEATSQTDIFGNTTNGLSQQGYLNGIAGVSQVFATALLTTPGNNTATGKVQFANYTQFFQQFNSSKFIGLFCNCEQNVGTITYEVSSIPLPASLPMVLLAVGGLFGFTRMNRKSVAA